MGTVRVRKVNAIMSERALGRASLARQLLLERSALGVAEAVAQVGGLQAQTTHSWYVSLWSRLSGFAAAEASRLLEERRLVRIAMMRGTIHLLTAEDCLEWRPLHEDFLWRATRSVFGREFAGADVEAVAARGRELVEAEPMTFAALGSALAADFPGSGASGLAQLVRARVPLVQVPPRGLWGRSGQAAHTSAESWLGAPVAARPAVEGFVARCLAAFGPASVKDVQAHCGLTRLKEVLERMDLVRLRGADGRILYDLPEAPRPSEDAPAPVRFLPDFDNLLLSFADRTRVNAVEALRWARAFPKHASIPGTVLLDGTVGATWATEAAKGATTLTVRPFAPLTSAQRAEVGAEGEALLRFLAPAHRHDLVLGEPW